MAINFNSNFNQEIRSIVRNYNKRRNNMIQKGYTNVPDLVRVSELKKRYESRSDLNRELNRLKNLSRIGILRKVENEGGAKAVAWKFQYVKTNLKNTQEYFTKELQRIQKRAAMYPSERQRIDTIQAKLNLLNLDISDMNQDQFRSAVAATNEFANSVRQRKESYRGFMREVDIVMQTLGLQDAVRDKFFKKFEKLTPEQFLYAYDNNPIITRVYELYFKRNDDGSVQLNTTDDNAEELINILMEEADDIILDAKNNVR